MKGGEQVLKNLTLNQCQMANSDPQRLYVILTQCDNMNGEDHTLQKEPTVVGWVSHFSWVESYPEYCTYKEIHSS
jgi:hypothetical protein